VAENLVAGNASGATLRMVRLRELVIVKEVIVTEMVMSASAKAAAYPAVLLTTILIPQIQCRGVLNSARRCAHGRLFQRSLPHHNVVFEVSDARRVYRSDDAIERG
jgi:hypothetical protein